MKYILIDWYLQQHGSFSSLGRWRDVSLTEFSSAETLREYLYQYLQKNYPHVSITDQEDNLLDLCQLAVEESDKLLIFNSDEISRVTSRHIWPLTHKLIMGCLTNIDLERKDNDNTNYCLITQLGHRRTDVKFVQGTAALRQELLRRFKNPFQTTSSPTDEQYQLFLQKSETLSMEELCNYVINRSWYDLDRNCLHGVLVDFIIIGEPLIFHPPSI